VDTVAVIPDPEPGTTPLSSVDGSGLVSDVGDPDPESDTGSVKTRGTEYEREEVTLGAETEGTVIVLKDRLEVAAVVVVEWVVDFDTIEEP
jgi:hypothetical protein